MTSKIIDIPGLIKVQVTKSETMGVFYLETGVLEQNPEVEVLPQGDYSGIFLFPGMTIRRAASVELGPDYFYVMGYLGDTNCYDKRRFGSEQKRDAISDLLEKALEAWSQDPSVAHLVKRVVPPLQLELFE